MAVSCRSGARAAARPVAGRRRCDRHLRLRRAARHHVHHAIAARLELAQQFRKGERGRRLDVVQQHHAFALFVEPRDRAPHHLGRADVLPVVGDDVGAPGRELARLEIRLHLVGAEKSRNAHERRRRPAFAERCCNRRKALLDLALHQVERHAVERQRMVLAVVADGVAGLADFAQQVRIAARHAADDEIGGLHAMLGQHIEHAVGVGRQRAVVEGQHDLVVLERQRARVVDRADARMLLRIDRQHAAGAERIRIARAIGGARRRRAERGRQQSLRERERHPLHAAHISGWRARKPSAAPPFIGGHI